MLISKIALRRGARLEISSLDQNTGLDDILSGTPTIHLSNLPSPAFMEYQSYPRAIQMLGPNGSFLFSCFPSLGSPFVEFPLLSLTNLRELYIKHHAPERVRSPPNSLAFHPSSFPALEALSIEYDAGLSRLLSALLSNPSASPSLNTIAFLVCLITECFMEELTRFASDRKNTTSARLHRVAIIDQDGDFPTAASIRGLGRHVPVVDVRFGTELPADLTRG